jgi:uncharacterized protein YoaH (UPF0181 family)
MVRQNLDETTIDGDANQVVSELAALLYFGTAEIAEQTGVDQQDVIDNVIDGSKVYKLIGSGMTTGEAIAMLGMTDTIAGAIEVDADGSRKTVLDTLKEKR